MSYADWLAAIAADSPTSWWKLNESGGSSAADSGSAGNTGTWQNAPTLGVAGDQTDSPNLAAHFNGGSTGTAGDALLLDPAKFGTPSSLTFECIFRPTAYAGGPGNASILLDITEFDGGDGVNGGDGVIFGYGNGSAGPFVQLNQTSLFVINVACQDPTPPILSTWHHFAAVVEASGGASLLSVYVDGCLRATALAPYLATWVVGRVMALGQQSKAAAESCGSPTSRCARRYIGDMDEAVLWASALSAARIKAHAAAAGYRCPGGWRTGSIGMS